MASANKIDDKTKRVEPDYEEMYIPPRPGGGCWEGGLNGNFFRFEGGKVVRVPTVLAALIRESGQVDVDSQHIISSYQGKGKRLA
jgi:hypothetical protein